MIPDDDLHHGDADEERVEGVPDHHFLLAEVRAPRRAIGRDALDFDIEVETEYSKFSKRIMDLCMVILGGFKFRISSCK